MYWKLFPSFNNHFSCGSSQRAKYKDFCRELQANVLVPNQLFIMLDLILQNSSLRPKSLEGLSKTYDFLYDRHIRNLARLEAQVQTEDVINGSNDEESSTNIVGPKRLHLNACSLDQDDSGSSFDESEKLSAIGEELVQKSLEEVTKGLSLSRLSSAAPGGREDFGRGGSSCSGKRVTFAESPALFAKAREEEENDVS
jgi:hypothetical protein